jgi:dTDP-4-dehydrorhamnose reductase
MRIDFGKVLITGAAGMVGSYFDFGIKTDRRSLDVTDFDQTLLFVKSHKPQAIIHLAVETDVDKCEREPRNAYLVNSAGAYHLALVSKKIGAKLVYISTAGVFDGEKDGPYT